MVRVPRRIVLQELLQRSSPEQMFTAPERIETQRFLARLLATDRR